MTEENPQSGHAKGDASAALLAAALGHVSDNPRVDALIERQIALADLQISDLEREDRLRHWSLRVHHVSDVLKLAFELAAAGVVTAIMLFIAGTVWSAVHDNGLVIEAFDVPAEFAQHGLTGKMLAGQLVDRLAKLQDATSSARPAASYSNNWGNDIKVQIPDAGISIGDFDRYLHEWLGHQTHISGELYRTPKGIALVARIGDRSATLEGQESDLATLLQKTAEAVYGETQPYRYAVYLDRSGRTAENIQVLNRLVSDTSPLERAWAYIGLANNRNSAGDAAGALAGYRMAQAQLADFPMPLWDAQPDNQILGHDEAVVTAGRKALRVFAAKNPYVSERARLMIFQVVSRTQAAELADFNDAIAHDHLMEALPDYAGENEGGREDELAAYGFLHDPASMHRHLNQFPAGSKEDQTFRLANLALGEFATAQWRDAARDYAAAQTALDHLGPSDLMTEPAGVWPYLAMTYAELGDRQHADALAAKMPVDCIWCAISRGRIDELEGKPGGAAYWFAYAGKQAPSVPYPDVYWGALLLRQGKYDDAIAKFDSAHKKGPHYADPLEWWGEALIAKNRSDLALAKFEEAARYAPNWGRLHLKWGEALWWSGKKDEALKQFDIASKLDLAPSEKLEVTRMKVGHGG